MPSHTSLKISFVVPYPLGRVPGQRFRFEQYLEILRSKGHQVDLYPFLDSESMKILYLRGHLIQKTVAVLKGMLRRVKTLWAVSGSDYIFLFREAMPFGPPLVEWFFASLMKKKIIYDFDDAIWITDKVNESVFERLIRWRKKVKYICKVSHIVSCSTQYLADFARKANPNVVIIPTTIDTDHVHFPHENKSTELEIAQTRKVRIGWTGSHSTLKYLKIVESALQIIEDKYPNSSVLITADVKPSMNIPRVDFIQWDIQNEIPTLSLIDIGIMPLPDDEWARGKAGFKALQFMAMKIPVVVSPVGANKEIVKSHDFGLFAITTQDWVDCLSYLIEHPEERKVMGNQARDYVVRHFSVAANAESFVALFG